jgi:hypothetical protein
MTNLRGIATNLFENLISLRQAFKTVGTVYKAEWRIVQDNAGQYLTEQRRTEKWWTV